MKIDEGVVKIKRTNVNAKLPVKGTVGSLGYDLAAAQAAVVPARGKCLVKQIYHWPCRLTVMVESPPDPD